jgi:hypothetical protein
MARSQRNSWATDLLLLLLLLLLFYCYYYYLAVLRFELWAGSLPLEPFHQSLLFIY